MPRESRGHARRAAQPKDPAGEATRYCLAQVLGATAGAALIKGLTRFGQVKDQTGALGANSWGAAISGGGAFVLEIVLTFLLVLVVLLVTNRPASAGFAGLAIGLTLAAVHLVAVPLDRTSVNPARSIGPAVLQGGERSRSCGCSSSRR